MFLCKSDTFLSAYSLLKAPKAIETCDLITKYCVLFPRLTHGCCSLKNNQDLKTSAIEIFFLKTDYATVY